jgi:hypothetical protein
MSGGATGKRSAGEMAGALARGGQPHRLRARRWPAERAFPLARSSQPTSGSAW